MYRNPTGLYSEESNDIGKRRMEERQVEALIGQGIEGILDT